MLHFAAVADDDTGATDLAGMLAERGLLSVVLIDVPRPEQFAEWTREAGAVIVAAGTRALPPREAYQRTQTAVRLLRSLAPPVIQIKYCSTFDSTTEGNIGPSIDAAMDDMGETFTVAVPALPVNGRTTYMGYHFVGCELLSDSHMRHHPLTPMTQANLTLLLQQQTQREVGLVPLGAVRGGAETLRTCLAMLRANGTNIALIDCTDADDLETIGQAIAGMPLITGSSGPAMVLPFPGLEKRKWGTSAATGSGYLVVAGSCSRATREQNSWFTEQGYLCIAADPLAPENGSDDAILAELRAGRPCLLRTASEPADFERVSAYARAEGITANDAGLRIANMLAARVAQIIGKVRPAGLIVAGGETSGAICRAAEFGALAVCYNIEPGVPLCRALGAAGMPVVLKSGNFGDTDFYGRAIAAMEREAAA